MKFKEWNFFKYGLGQSSALEVDMVLEWQCNPKAEASALELDILNLYEKEEEEEALATQRSTVK